MANWQTPKTDWSAADGVMDSDFNRIEGNIQHLYEREVDTESFMLSSNLTVYVSVTGNDATGDGTSSNPFRYVNKALSTIPKNLNGFTATIMTVGNSTDSVTSAVVNITRFSNGRIIFRPSGSATAVVFGHQVVVSDKSMVELASYGSVKFSGGLQATYDAVVYSTSTTTVEGQSLSALYGGLIVLTGNVTIQSTSTGVLVDNIGRITVGALSIASTVTNGLWASNGGVISYSSLSNFSTNKQTTIGGGFLFGGTGTGSLPGGGI